MTCDDPRFSQGSPLAVLRELLVRDLSAHIPYTGTFPMDVSEARVALAAVERLVEAARHVVYPFDFDPSLPSDEWRGSELIAALAPFPAKEET